MIGCPLENHPGHKNRDTPPAKGGFVLVSFGGYYRVSSNKQAVVISEKFVRHVKRTFIVAAFGFQAKVFACPLLF